LQIVKRRTGVGAGTRLPAKGSDRWDELTGVAAKIFLEKGFNGATLEDIGSELGMLKGSLYHYIDSKDDLLYQVVLIPFQEALSRMNQIVAGSEHCTVRLTHAISAHMAIIDEYFPRMSVGLLLLRMNLSPPKARVIQQIRDEYESLWMQLLKEGINEGVFRSDFDARIALFSLMGVMNWSSRWYKKGGRLRVEDVATTMQKFVLRGLLAPRSVDSDLRELSGSSPRRLHQAPLSGQTDSRAKVQ
jgi:TetR/AcrR family transcriptional regulator, cholesterol catabolism regulator